jgi:aminoglycoside phosphotransferase (APT) family kinase protein
LDDDVVRSLLREQFPELAEEPVAYLDEGYDHQMYEVGDEWLFRFPKRADVVPWFLREVTIMPAIAEVIGVPVPCFEKIGSAGGSFPYPFAGYRRLPGIDADETDCFDGTAVAHSLGRALSRLHSLDTALIPSAPKIEEHDQAEPRADEVLMHVPAPIRDEVGALLRNEIPCPAFPGPRRVVHNDLLPEHVLIDPSTGRLAAIIDFADLCIGDPSVDFAGLLAIGGIGFVDEVLASYRLPIDGLFFDRLRWHTRVLYLEWLVDADEDGEDLTECQELVAVAFADDYLARARSSSMLDTT